MPAQVAGNIDHFANEIQTGLFQYGHGFGGKLAGVYATKGDFCGSIAFGSGGLDLPAAEAVAQVVQIAVFVALQGAFPAVYIPECLIITSRGQHCDFVSRYFAPGAGIAEDPVTGSIHSVLVPYWAEKLGKTRFDARQLSRRGGRLRCELKGDRVAIAGQAVLYMEGTVYLP